MKKRGSMRTAIAVSGFSAVLLLHATPVFADEDHPPPLPPAAAGTSRSDLPVAAPPAPAPSPANPAQATRHPWAAAPASQSSVKLTYESTNGGEVQTAQPAQADHPAEAPKSKSPDDSIVLHGFRLGYGYVFNYDDPSASFENKSFKDRVGLKSPHHFLLGYEIVYRVVGHSWLNVLLMGNGMIAGLEQSKVLPSANLLIGAEIKNSFQVGVGANLSPLKGSEAHTIVAAGWTPRVGTIYTPIHAYFIPDVDGYHRMGVTTGVTF